MCIWAPDDVSHHAPALIDTAHLEEAVARAGVTTDTLKGESGNYIKLEFSKDVIISCLRGKHLVTAAKGLFPREAERLIVRLYSNG